MSKKMAHVILLLANIFALIMFWFGCSEVERIFSEAATLVESISFQNRLGFTFIGITLPLVYLFAVWEKLWPINFNRRRDAINRVATVVGIGLIAGAILFSVYLQNHVEDAGYVYCDGAMRPSSIFKTLVYARDEDVCRRLTSEYRLSMHLPPK